VPCPLSYHLATENKVGTWLIFQTHRSKFCRMSLRCVAFCFIRGRVFLAKTRFEPSQEKGSENFGFSTARLTYIYMCCRCRCCVVDVAAGVAWFWAVGLMMRFGVLQLTFGIIFGGNFCSYFWRAAKNFFLFLGCEKAKAIERVCRHSKSES